MSDISGWVEELRRRHVFRTAVWYAAGAWLLIQFATSVFPVLQLPAWTIRLVVVLTLLGFPVAVGLAWLFEVRAETPTQATPKAPRLSMWVALAAGVLLMVGAWRAFVPSTSNTTSVGSTVAPTVLVLLPSDLRPEALRADNLAPRLQDALLDSLAQESLVKEISRSVANAFQPTKDDPLEFARRANATHFVEWSISQDESARHVILQLIDATDGSHVASYSFDYDIGAEFERELATRTTGALRILLGPEDWASDGAIKSEDPTARQLFKQAEVATRYGLGGDADPLYAEAFDRDPAFIQALGRRRLMLQTQGKALPGELERTLWDIAGWRHGVPESFFRGYLRELLSRDSDREAEFPDAYFFTYVSGYAYQVEPLERHFAKDPYAWIARGNTAAQVNRNYTKAFECYKRARELDPYLLDARRYLMNEAVYARKWETALPEFEQISALWPYSTRLDLDTEALLLLRTGDIALARSRLEASLREWQPPAEPGRDRNRKVVEMSYVLALLAGDLTRARAEARWLGDEQLSHANVDAGVVIQRRETGAEADAVLAFIAGDTRAARTYATRRVAENDLRIANVKGQVARAAGMPIDLLFIDTFWRYISEPKSIGLDDIKVLEERLDVTHGYAHRRGDVSRDEPVQQLAFLYAWSGAKHDAVRILERCLKARGGCYAQAVARDPWWTPLYGDAEFEKLLLANGAALVRHPRPKR